MTYIESIKPILVSDQDTVVFRDLEFATIFKMSEIEGLEENMKLHHGEENGKGSWRHVVNCIINETFGFRVMRKNENERTVIADWIYDE